MTETQTIHDMARAHWWHRAKTDDLQAAICLGAADPAAQLAADEIKQAWDEAKDVEIAAMRAALSGVTLEGWRVAYQLHTEMLALVEERDIAEAIAEQAATDTKQAGNVIQRCAKNIRFKEEVIAETDKLVRVVERHPKTPQAVAEEVRRLNQWVGLDRVTATHTPTA